MDDDIASLIALTLICNRAAIIDGDYFASIGQLTLSLYLMTQCQFKLHLPVESLTKTLDHIKVARGFMQKCPLQKTLGLLILQMTERKIQKMSCKSSPAASLAHP